MIPEEGYAKSTTGTSLGREESATYTKYGCAPLCGCLVLTTHEGTIKGSTVGFLKGYTAFWALRLCYG